jgi:hypothetical protein
MTTLAAVLPGREAKPGSSGPARHFSSAGGESRVPGDRRSRCRGPPGAGGDMQRPRRVKEPGNVNPYATALGNRDTA